MNKPPLRREPQVKPIVVFWVCLAVALSMFAGSIAIGVFVVQDSRDRPAQSDGS